MRDGIDAATAAELEKDGVYIINFIEFHLDTVERLTTAHSDLTIDLMPDMTPDPITDPIIDLNPNQCPDLTPDLITDLITDLHPELILDLTNCFHL